MQGTTTLVRVAICSTQTSLMLAIALPAPQKPKPRSLVPQFFGRDKNFVGREDIIKEIEKKLAVNDYHNRLALTGLGGIG